MRFHTRCSRFQISLLPPGNHDDLDTEARTERPNILGSSKLQECITTAGVEAVVALNSG